jgi:hypothetical protein
MNIKYEPAPKISINCLVPGQPPLNCQQDDTDQLIAVLKHNLLFNFFFFLSLFVRSFITFVLSYINGTPQKKV